MAGELITDDFNRSDQNLTGSVSAEGWSWEKVNADPSSMKIGSANGVDGTPGVRNGAGISTMVYRADVNIPSAALMGAQVDVSNHLNSNGVQLGVSITDSSNYIYASFSHADGALAITKVGLGGSGVLGTTTIAVPARPYTATFIQDGGSFTFYIDGVSKLTASSADIEILLADQRVGLVYTGVQFVNMRVDNFRGGFPWLLGIGSAPSTADESDPSVQRSILDEQRRANLMGGRASTILTSALGLDDDVPTARVHLLGRCGLRPAVQVVGGGTTVIEDAGTTVAPTFHASTAKGDTVFAFIMRRSAVTPPTGWTLVVEQKAATGQGATDQWLSVYKKIYEASDGASVTFTQAVSGRMTGHVVTVRPKDASSIQVLDTQVGTYSFGNTPGLHPIQGVVATANGQIVLSGSACVFAGNYAAPGEWTQTTPTSVADNRLLVAHRPAPTDAPVSGVHSHSVSLHDSSEISILLGVSA